jgi:hypothetical protein
MISGEFITIIGIWFLAVCILLLGSLFVGLSVKESKLIRLFPLWVLGYCLSLPAITPLLWYRWWEGPETFIMIVHKLIVLTFIVFIIASLVVAFVKKRFGTAIGIIVMGMLLCVYSLFTLTFMGLSEGHGDNFGKRHPISDNMAYYTFLEDVSWTGKSYSQSYLDSLTIERGIVLLQNGQDGQYRYFANIPAIPEKGHIYLQLYEATTDLPLSASAVKTSTTLPVEPSDTARIYMMKDEKPNAWNDNDRFVIYEGSWDDYYAARVELWYQPQSSEDAQLLHSVIYKIEGWSR